MVIENRTAEIAPDSSGKARDLYNIFVRRSSRFPDGAGTRLASFGGLLVGLAHRAGSLARLACNWLAHCRCAGLRR